MHQIFVHTIFMIFALVAVIAALLMVTLNNPVQCVLSLVLTFISTAGLWLLAEAEFLSLILVLVYVGAVMTFFLFVVMMINVDEETRKRNFVRYLPLGVIMVALLVTLMITAIAPESFANATQTTAVSTNVSNTEALGLVIYTHYAYAFELAAVLLLIAIISAITLVHRGPRNSKQQQLRQQLMVNSKDRVRLVKMSAQQGNEL